MERNVYDLTHFMHIAGKLGRLQTLNITPVAPGDSIEMHIDGIVRLAPLRKEVVSETQVDICAFYIPHRHIFPDWPDRIQVGRTFEASGGINDPSFSVGPDARDLSYLCLDYAGETIPRWILQGYNQIWDRYFRVPSLARDNTELTFPSTQSEDHKAWRLYGRRCARLPHPANDGVRVTGGTATGQPWRNLLPSSSRVSISSDAFDVRGLAATQGAYKSQIERAWFTERYKDVLDRTWGTTVNIDADQRPEMLMRETFNMSGHDVDGTDDAALGQYIGKTVSRLNFSMPRKFFNEHGAVWVVALMRHPFVHVGEKHPFIYSEAEIDGFELLADPNIFSTLPPQTYNPARWLAPPWGADVSDANAQTPFGQAYRMHNNRIHKNFADIPGYPFLKQTISNLEEASYYQVKDYDDVFQTSQLAHWQVHARAGITALRKVSSAATSVYVGT